MSSRTRRVPNFCHSPSRSISSEMEISERSSVRGGQIASGRLSASSLAWKSKYGIVCTLAGSMVTLRSRLRPLLSSRVVISGSVSRPSPSAIRFWISEVMNTVLPERLRPVTARRMRFSFIDLSTVSVRPETVLRRLLQSQPPNPCDWLMRVPPPHRSRALSYSCRSVPLTLHWSSASLPAAPSHLGSPCHCRPGFSR